MFIVFYFIGFSVVFSIIVSLFNALVVSLESSLTLSSFWYRFFSFLNFFVLLITAYFLVLSIFIYFRQYPYSCVLLWLYFLYFFSSVALFMIILLLNGHLNILFCYSPVFVYAFIIKIFNYVFTTYNKSLNLSGSMKWIVYEWGSFLSLK